MKLPWCLTVGLGRLERAVKWEKWHLLLISVLFLLPACAVEADWQFVSPMPHERYWHDATLGPDGKIYIMGGTVFRWRTEKGVTRKFNDGELWGTFLVFSDYSKCSSKSYNPFFKNSK